MEVTNQYFFPILKIKCSLHKAEILGGHVFFVKSIFSTVKNEFNRREENTLFARMNQCKLRRKKLQTNEKKNE